MSKAAVTCNKSAIDKSGVARIQYSINRINDRGLVWPDPMLWGFGFSASGAALFREFLGKIMLGARVAARTLTCCSAWQ